MCVLFTPLVIPSFSSPALTTPHPSPTPSSTTAQHSAWYDDRVTGDVATEQASGNVTASKQHIIADTNSNSYILLLKLLHHRQILSSPATRASVSHSRHSPHRQSVYRLSLTDSPLLHATTTTTVSSTASLPPSSARTSTALLHADALTDTSPFLLPLVDIISS